ncbi:hypothetical protein ACFWBR_42390 [Streptomyces sp. NPDC060006]|uniref:hypothetical protein n=1 Tax=unclassified Streptomyces TaxID=2593676 RepID=UPI00369CB116
MNDPARALGASITLVYLTLALALLAVLARTRLRTRARNRRRARAALRPTFTCPRCTRTSHHPMDLRYGWCGHCSDYTGTPTERASHA